MRFKNYCVVVIGKVDGVRDLISKITETELRCLEQKGVFIGTFSCIMSAKELKDILDRESKTFFVFEVGDESNAYQIGRADIHEQLFAHIENGGDVLSIMSDNLMNEVNVDRMSGSTADISTKEVSLQIQLDEAIIDEDYAKAAELRDLIKLRDKG